MTAGTPVFSSGTETLPITITGNNISLDSLQAIASLKFLAMVTKTMQTPITMSNLQLNGGDQNFANCILSADTTNSTFNLIAVCGDSTLSKFMNGILPMKIISLRPNPAQDEIIIDVVAPAFSRSGTDNSSGSASLETASIATASSGTVSHGTAESRPYYVGMFDALGYQLFSGDRYLSPGTNEIHLDTKNLSGGMYLVRIGSESRSFVKVR